MFGPGLWRCARATINVHGTQQSLRVAVRVGALRGGGSEAERSSAESSGEIDRERDATERRCDNAVRAFLCCAKT